MSDYILYKFESLGWSDNSNNSGHTPRKAKSLKTFLNIITGVLHSQTDLAILKSKRDNAIKTFYNTYKRLYEKQEISILSFVVYEEDYPSISKFLNTISAKLRRKLIRKLGYIWVRDVGDIKFEPHYHIILATSRISKDDFENLFLKKLQKFKVEFQKTKSGLKKYLLDKELFGKKGQRTFGRSKSFKKK